ncbi:hypothetical protein V8F20_000681 [Naviculisporaceae sp. PSN 640]
MRDITELPCDLFLLIIAYLPPRTCIRCRRVSRQWYEAFTSEDISLLLLRWNFPRCREMRLAAAAASLSSLSPKALESLDSLSSNNLAVELKCFAAAAHSWSSTFAAVARRYHHLRHAKPRVVDKIELAGLSQNQDGDGPPSVLSFRGVAQWNRYLRLDQNTANFHYDDPSWWYSQEDGVLVYPAAVRINDRDESHSEPLLTESETGYIYQVLDLSTGTQVSVPFDVRHKHIRRVRLSQGVLVFEWAEALPYHQLNDREVVHRHFVTAFDVVRIPSELSHASPGTTSESGDTRWTWTVKLRSEWKLHFLGLPLNRSDRFFSAHTATHYAVYFWQPNRSLYQDDPIEQLAVWDISSPSNYRPSEDPTGDKHPGASERSHSIPVGLWNGAQNGTNGTNSDRTGSSSVHSSSDGDTKPSSSAKAKTKSTPTGPRVIRRMAWRELGFYNLRQRATPQLRNLALDERNLYFVEEEHRWADGQHSSLSPPRVHHVRCTGIPIIPATPACPLSTSSSSGTPKRPPLAVIHNSSSVSVVESPIDGPVLGPIWVDACGADGDVNMSFCRRAAASSGPIAALESWATPRRIQLGTLNNASPEYIMGLLKSRDSTSADGWAWTAADSSTLSGDSKPGKLNAQDVIASFTSSPQRWPGWAPCWRHEDFPYLTVAEMVDFAAGVRITARHCFMLETISVHVRPGSISVKGATTSNSDDDGAGPSTSTSRPAMTSYQKKKITKRRTSSTATAGRSEEVQFADDMWSELVHKGYLAGDERWVLGEDEKGRITIVRF